MLINCYITKTEKKKKDLLIIFNSFIFMHNLIHFPAWALCPGCDKRPKLFPCGIYKHVHKYESVSYKLLAVCFR